MKVELNEAEIKQAVLNFVSKRLEYSERDSYTYTATLKWRSKIAVVELTKKAK